MKVALLIPTLNRPSFIQRTVLYYNALHSPHPIYIGDASDTEISKNTLLFLKNIKNVQVKYFHWKELNLEQTVLKLAEEASAECEYCAFQGDDDYFIPTSLTKGAAFLLENSDYRTVQGRAALIVMDKPEPVGNIRWIDEYWGKHSLEESSRIERLFSFHNNYYVNQFSVHRISEFISDSLDFATINDHYIHELLHCYTFAIHGKSKFIDCLYLIRVRHPDLFIHSPRGNLFEFTTRKNWSHEYKKLIDSLSCILSDDKKMSFPEAKKIISDLMKKNHLKILANNEGDKKSFYIKLKKAIYGYLTHILLDKTGLRSIRESFRTKNNMQLWTTKGSRFHSDFLAVKNSLTGKGLHNDEK